MNLDTRSLHLAPFALVLFALVGCSSAAPTRAPTLPPILGVGDASYGGYAFLDENDNGVLDAGDLPIKGATLYLLIGKGKLSAVTGESGFALIRFPFPFTGQSFEGKMWMEPPEGSGYTIASPEYIEIRCCTAGANFLFKRDKGK